LHTSEKIFYIIQYLFIVFAVAIILIKVYYSLNKKSHGKLLNLSMVIAALGLLALADMYLLEPNWIKIERVEIHDAALAQALKGEKVVQISDIHLKGLGFRERELTEKINELHPDILFITGDYFSTVRGKEADDQYKAIYELVKSFKVSTGIFGILGNYDDYLLNHPERLQELRNAGIMILHDENIKVLLSNDRMFWLAGSFYDAYHNNSSSFTKSIESIPPKAPIILLNHYPDVFDKAVNAGINLVLAGHTHGGQIGIPFLIHISNYANKSPYMKGLFRSGKTQMYVNRGIGTAVFPVRFLCRPEITVFEFLN
jgi:predicted MPP superfamily phosphohydrolase